MRVVHWITLGLLLTGCSMSGLPVQMVKPPVQGADTSLPQPSRLDVQWQSRTSSSFLNWYATTLNWSADSSRLELHGGQGYIQWETSSGRVLQRRSNLDCDTFSYSYGAPIVGALSSSDMISRAGNKLICRDGVYTLDYRQRLFQVSVSEYSNFLSWSPDGRLLLLDTASMYGEIHRLEVLDGNTGALLRTLREGGAVERNVAWKPDSSAILYGGEVLDVLDGSLLGTVISTDDELRSPDWRYVARGQYASRTVTIHDLATDTLRLTLNQQYGQTYGNSWSTDGRYFAVASDFDSVEVWDVDNAQKVMDYSPPAQEGYIVSAPVRFSPDARKLAVLYHSNLAMEAGRDDEFLIKVLDVATGQVESNLRLFPQKAHDANVYTLQTTMSPLLLSASRDGSLLQWNLDARDAAVRLTAHSDAVYALATRPGSRQFASGGADAQIWLWDRPVADGPDQPAQPLRTLSGHTYTVRSLAFSPDGATLASGSWDSSVRLWNPDTAEQTALLTGHTNYVNAVAYSPDGATLASASNDTTVKLWNPSSGVLKQTLSGHTDAVLTLAWSPDGSKLATGGATGDRSVKLWNAQTGILEQTLKGARGAVRALAWSPGGQTLYAVGDDTQVHAWNTLTGEQVLEQNLSTVPLFSLTLSPDGKTLYAGDAQGQVSAWDVR